MSYIPWRLEGGDMDDFDYYITVKDENRMVRDKSHKKKIILKEKEKNIIIEYLRVMYVGINITQDEVDIEMGYSDETMYGGLSLDRQCVLK